LKLKNVLVIMLSLSVITYCLVAAFFLSNNSTDNFDSLIMISIFNLLFASIIFQLRGSLPLKFGVLAAGNFFGLCWNLFFEYLFLNICSPFITTTVFHVSYVVLFPFLNVLCFVTFWSLSLTVFSRLNNGKGVMQF
jgi:hypothetical protein